MERVIKRSAKLWTFLGPLWRSLCVKKKCGTVQTLAKSDHPSKLSAQARGTWQLWHLQSYRVTLAETEEPVQTSTSSSAPHRSRLCGREAKRKPLWRKADIKAKLEFTRRSVRKTWELLRKDFEPFALKAKHLQWRLNTQWNTV